MATITVGAGKTHATITAAIAASTNGDTIEVYAGTYDAETAATGDANKYLHVTGKTGLTFTAMGAVILKAGHNDTLRVIRIANGANDTTFNCGTGGSWTIDGFLSNGTARQMLVDAYTSVTSITGLTFDGSAGSIMMKGGAKTLKLAPGSVAVTSATLTDDGKALGNGGCLVSVEGANDATFTGCTFNRTDATGTPGYVVSIAAGTDANNVIFSGCTFTGGCATNIIHNIESANLTVDQCTFTMNLAGTDSIIGVEANAKNGAVTITDNIINVSVALAENWIDVRSTKDGVYHAVIIRGNRFVGTTPTATANTQCVYLVNQQGAIVSGNTFITSATTGTFKHIYITANGDADSNAAGAVVTYNTCKYSHHAGHTIIVGTDGYTAAAATYCDTALIEGNTVIYIGSAAQASRSVHAILFGWSKKATIRGNYVEGAGIGIAVKSGGTALQDWDATGGVIGNTIVNCSYMGGIAVKASVDVVVENNIVYVSPTEKVAGGYLVRVIPGDAGADGGGNCDGIIIRYNTIYAPSTCYCLQIEADQTVSSLLDNKYYVTGASSTAGYVAMLSAAAKTWAQLLTAYPTAGSYLASDAVAETTGALNRVLAAGAGASGGIDPRWRRAGAATF